MKGQVLHVANNAYAQLQPPIPSAGKIGSNPQSHTNSPEKKTKNDLRGTNDAPFIVDIVKTKPEEERADQESKDAHQSAADNRHILICTGIIAFFAFLQWTAIFYQGIRVWDITSDYFMKIPENDKYSYIEYED